MFAKIYSAAVYRVDTYEVEIAVNGGDLTSFFATHKNYDVDFSEVKGGARETRDRSRVPGGHNLLIL
jgi:hypothetical protein